MLISVRPSTVNGPTQLDVPARPCSVPGLAITQISPRVWRVTHVASGHAVAHPRVSSRWPSPEAADEAARTCLTGIDWTRSAAELDADPVAREAARRLGER